MNALQTLMGLDPETGEYTRSYMLRRLSQAALCAERGISNAEIARRTGVTREQIRLYFLGTGAVYADRPDVREDIENEVEKAIEDFTRETGFAVSRVLDTPEETYIDEITTRRLMQPEVNRSKTGGWSPLNERADYF